MHRKTIKRSLPGAVLVGSFLIALACAAGITLFGDDYGYVRYADGGAFFSRMAEHFMTVNGRTLFHAIDVLLLQGRGIPGKAVIVLCIPALWLGVARVAAGGKKQYRIAAAAAVLFWTVGLPALRESVFWITGAMNYLVPTTLTVWQIAAAKRRLETGGGIVGFCVLSVLTAAATEFSAAVSVVLVIGMLAAAVRRKDKRCAAVLCAVLLFVLAAAATVFLAPGNALRTSFYPEFYAEPFFTRAAAHYAEFSAVCLSDTGILPALTILAAAAFARCCGEKRYAAGAAVGCFAAAAVAADLGGLFAGETAAFASLPVVAVGTAITLIFLTDLRRCRLEAALTLAAFAVQAAMLTSPVFGPRTTFLSSILLLTAALRVMAEDGFSLPLGLALTAALPILLPVRLGFSLLAVLGVLLSALAARLIRRRGTGSVLALLLAFFCLAGGAAVARGYVRNGLVYRENDRRIDAYLASPEGDLELLLPPVGACRYTYPSDGSPWHDEQFRLWRGIPRETVIRFDGGGA